MLAQYGVATALIRHDSALAALMDLSPAWEQVYLDDLAAIYERRGEESGG
jgi:hypothetical protein